MVRWQQTNHKYTAHARKPMDGKIPVTGAVERGGRVRAQVIPNVEKTTLLPLVAEHVMPESVVFTDELKSYTGLGKAGYHHSRVNHKAKVYVLGNVHTNTIEGFCSLVKRGIRGTNHAVGAEHLEGYINSYAFR